jgi:uncharacterized membrane protein
MKLGAYMLIIVISFWYISPFISIVSFFIFFDQWKFDVYFIQDKYCYPCLFTGAIGLVNLLPAFFPQPVLISVDGCVSCRQKIVGSSFLIQFANGCLLMGEFSPLTFSVSIDSYLVIPVI